MCKNESQRVEFSNLKTKQQVQDKKHEKKTNGKNVFKKSH